MTKLTVGVFGDAGNSFYNASAFYYKPGFYSQPDQKWKSLYSTGGTAPVQQSVADMVRRWGVSELIQLGDTAYNAQSSTLLDYQIGKYYNDYMQPYGNKPADFAYADPNSIYSTAEGGVVAELGKLQWPFNLYDFPNGFPNPAIGGPGGSSDGLNHFWALQGNHDYGTIIGAYNDYNVNHVDRQNIDIGVPSGPDAYDYQSNSATWAQNPYEQKLPTKDSAQQLLDYLPYLKTGDDAVQPSYLKPGQVRIGSNDPTGNEGIYYSVDLGQATIDGVSRPLLHVLNLDTPRIYVDAGYYDFQGISRKAEAIKQGLSANNYSFDPTSSTQKALFDGSPENPSASYQMFEWAKQDLEQSTAVWKVVAGHHTSYHAGAVGEDANSNNFSNPIIVKFLAGLKDGNGKPLFDASWNGHSHAYSRVLEMGDAKHGIGVGIPLITTGNGGKDEDYLNLVPYGSNVLEPQNWANIYFEKDGTQTTNAATSGLTSSYLASFPAGTNPTSVGTSGPYRYDDSDNLPSGYDQSKPDSKYFTTKIIATAPNPDAKDKEFTFQVPQYNSILAGSGSSSALANADVSGLYGYGSGAMFVEADDGYMWMNYSTTVPLDPAVTLIGRQQGLSTDQMQRGSLFYEQWSPTDATIDNLALFSFDVLIDESHPEGYIDHLQLVHNGQGYMESSLDGSDYLDVTYTFEIQGNNPVDPKGADQPDSSRAAVDLHFLGGQLVGVAFAKDQQGNLRQGTGYKELANSINGDNRNNSSARSALVGININLESQYFLADQSPDNSLYNDWYLLADTAIHSTALSESADVGPYGGLQLNLQPKAQRARDILASQPVTTGYNLTGPQNKYPNPQQGLLSVKDTLDRVVAGGSSVPLASGNVTLNLSSLPAPGPLAVSFGGDPFSSYQVNFKPADTVINISYGDWSSGLSVLSGQTLSFSEDVQLNLSRSDANAGSVSFGLLPAGSTSPTILLRDAAPAQAAALTTSRIFTASGESSWLASEGQRQGSSAATSRISAGNWTPVAVNAAGQSLAVQTIISSGNTAEVTFAGGIQARFATPGTGTASSLPSGGKPQLILHRLGRQLNGLAFYEADPLTGAIPTTSGTLLPGQSGYLQQALRNATAAGLRLAPSDLPEYQAEKVYDALPLKSDRNYGMLLIRGNDSNDLASSYSQANANTQVVVQSFAAPGRGVCFGIEDLVGSASDFDFNDIIGRIIGSTFSII